MTAAKEYTIPDLTYAGSHHAGKVMVDRVDHYASLAREAKLSADYLQEQCRSANYLAIANDRAKRISGLLNQLDGMDSLRAFANAMVEAAFEGGSLDGGDIQDIAVNHGVLRIEVRAESCGEACNCHDFGFPVECYRKTELLKVSV